MLSGPASSGAAYAGRDASPAVDQRHARPLRLLLTPPVRTIFPPTRATIRRTYDCHGSNSRHDVPSLGLMNDSDAERLSRLRHDLSNPLSALLAEAQLLLLNESKMDAETLTGLREIEALAIRMRTMLREL